MPTSRTHQPQFSLPGSPSFSRWQLDRLFSRPSSSWLSSLWNALKFIVLLPVALALFLANLVVQLAVLAGSVLMIPILILAPVLGISALILLAGFFFELLGVGI